MENISCHSSIIYKRNQIEDVDFSYILLNCDSLIDSSVSSSYIRQLRTVTTIIYTARKRHCKFCGI